MPSLYYIAAWTDSGCFSGCDHEHKTIASAVACIPCAGGYIVAVQENNYRELNRNEEIEFQQALSGYEERKRNFGLLEWPKPVPPVSD